MVHNDYGREIEWVKVLSKIRVRNRNINYQWRCYAISVAYVVSDFRGFNMPPEMDDWFDPYFIDPVILARILG
jgi:hypothetical protein